MLDTIFRHYKAKQLESSQASQQSQNLRSAKNVEKPVPLFRSFLNSFSNKNQTINSELKIYFSEPVIVSQENHLWISILSIYFSAFDVKHA